MLRVNSLNELRDLYADHVGEWFFSRNPPPRTVDPQKLPAEWQQCGDTPDPHTFQFETGGYLIYWTADASAYCAIAGPRSSSAETAQQRVYGRMIADLEKEVASLRQKLEEKTVESDQKDGEIAVLQEKLEEALSVADSAGNEEILGGLKMAFGAWSAAKSQGIGKCPHCHKQL